LSEFSGDDVFDIVLDAYSVKSMEGDLQDLLKTAIGKNAYLFQGYLAQDTER
jgi:hypothetical protein